MINFKLNKFLKIFRDLDFFKNKRFENVNFEDEKIIANIKQIYGKLSEFIGIRYVGATKIMHLMNPYFFMMWDSNIISMNHISRTPDGYLKFMRDMQKKWIEDKFPKPKVNDTIPRAIDRYNTKRARLWKERHKTKGADSDKRKYNGKAR